MISNDLTAIILILHGSPRENSNAPAQALGEALRQANGYGHVTLAFMECNSPTIAEAVDDCAGRAVSQIIAVPYLLHTGRHLVLDIPEMLMTAAAAYPHITVLITDPVGAAAAATEALAARATEAMIN